MLLWLVHEVKNDAVFEIGSLFPESKTKDLLDRLNALRWKQRRALAVSESFAYSYLAPAAGLITKYGDAALVLLPEEVSLALASAGGGGGRHKKVKLSKSSFDEIENMMTTNIVQL
jgi:hypothetical protein